jgi:hypothetical protein
MCHNMYMTKRMNWNMLHYSRCPKCRGKLIPANAEGVVLECRNAYDENIRCDFAIRTSKLESIRSSLISKVYA